MNRLFYNATGVALAFVALVAMGSLAFAQEAKEAVEAQPDTKKAPSTTKTGKEKVMIIPVRAQIDKPALYILRRGLKDAINQDVDTVVIDMETPGGSLGVTFDILKAIEKFPGKTITYVNREATSAGAIISAGTDEIWMQPMATIGSAEPVTATGKDINESMQRKILSYLKAKIRAMTEAHPYRGDVISAMMDPSVELVIGEEVISPKDDLLNLTASEAITLYGEPSKPLLAAGKADSIDALLDGMYGEGNYSVHRIEPSWSEGLATLITALTPVLLAFGLLGLFVEFKTPGFGIFGVGGLILLSVVFFGHHTAGLSGYEPMLLLLIGLVLIGLEIFVFPGTGIPAVLGAILVIGSLVWAMLDIWPDQPIELSGAVLTRPLINVTLGIAGAVILFIALLRFLPGSGPWGGMVLETAVAGAPDGIHPVHAPAEEGAAQSDLVGSPAVAATDLYPSGQVSIDGKRYEARVEVGSVDAGTKLVVTQVAGFGLIVEKASTTGKEESS